MTTLGGYRKGDHVISNDVKYKRVVLGMVFCVLLLLGACQGRTLVHESQSNHSTTDTSTASQTGSSSSTSQPQPDTV
ncbi:hypothetical protein, partial [Neobacillus drentensis]|uniref:hypothetical protein n=1 Tax=Neobacillus drentensis TaxID=220684 RepID=UPI0030019C95